MYTLYGDAGGGCFCAAPFHLETYVLRARWKFLQRYGVDDDGSCFGTRVCRHTRQLRDIQITGKKACPGRLSDW